MKGWMNGRKEGRTYLVAIKLLEQVNGLLEVIDDLLLRGVVVVAVWLDSVDAGSWPKSMIMFILFRILRAQGGNTMLVPLVLPERLVIALVVLPVLVHVGEKLGAARVLDDGSDVGVLARLVAVCLVGAIAVVGPSRGLSVKN